MADTEIGRLTLIFEGQIKDVVSKIDDLTKSVGGLSKDVETHTHKASASWKDMAAGYITGAFSVEAVKAVFESVKKLAVESVKAFDDEAVSMARLQAQLGSTAVVVKEFAEARQKATRIADDEVMAAAAVLGVYVKNEKNLKDLVKAAHDYATVMGGSLESAAQLYLRSLLATSDGIGRLRVGVSGAAGSQERLNSIIERSTQYFGGQAEAIAKVGAGPLVQLTNNLDNLKESLGEILTGGINPFVETINNEVIPALDAWLKKLNDLLNPSKELQKTHAEFMVRDLQRRIDDQIERLVKTQAVLNGSFTDKLKDYFTGGTGNVTGIQEVIDNLKKEQAAWQRTIEQLGKELETNGAPPPPPPPPGDEKALPGTQLTTVFQPNLTQLAENAEKWSKVYEDISEKDYKQLEKNTEEHRKAAEELKKIWGDLEKRQQQSANETRRISEGQTAAVRDQVELFISLGEQLGRALAEGFTDGSLDLESSFNNILKVFLSFLEKLLIGAIMQRTIADFATAGIAGLALAAIGAAAVTAVIEVLKSSINIKMGEGGPIGGRPHSAGGTFLEAEYGEYITKRQAVDYYGVSAMEAVNRMLVPREALAGYTGGNVSTAQPRAAAGGQVGVARERVIVNVMDERMLDKFLSTTEGQDAIVNVISSNSRKVRRVLEG